MCYTLIQEHMSITSFTCKAVSIFKVSSRYNLRKAAILHGQEIYQPHSALRSEEDLVNGELLKTCPHYAVYLAFQTTPSL